MKRIFFIALLLVFAGAGQAQTSLSDFYNQRTSAQIILYNCWQRGKVFNVGGDSVMPITRHPSKLKRFDLILGFKI